MKCKIVPFICLLVVLSMRNFAQNNIYLNNYTQPAPNAAALGKFADFPVSYHTGLAKIEIPIYNLVDGACKLNISLNYHASGIRVAEVASWVGLGWALNAGGVITRTVRGAPDEGAKVGGAAYGPKGYYRDSGIRKMPLLSSAELTQTYPSILSGAVDGEPDIFFFNFNGHIGKFVFDEYKNIRILSEDNYKVEPNYNGDFESWKITTPDGVAYIFGEGNAKEKTLPHSNVTGDNANDNVPSSWYLTKVIYPDDKDTLVLTYTPESYGYHDIGPERLEGNDYILQKCYVPQTGNMIKTTIEGVRLASIKSRNYRVDFIADTLREDLTLPGKLINISGPNNSARRLDKVKVYNSRNECIRQFELQYSYFISSATSGFNPAILANIGDIDRKRLKLLSLREVSGDGTIRNPPYIFQYEETQLLPRRISYSQDHWGFANGWGNNRLTPRPLDCTEGGYINREASWPAMKGCALVAITNPLGSRTDFTYGPHMEGYSKVIGGLRIEKIVTQDNITKNRRVRKFNYNDINGSSSGVLYSVPTYFIPVRNEYFLDRTSGNPGPTAPFVGYITGGGFSFFVNGSQSVVPMQTTQGSHFGYSYVKEIIGENQEGGYIAYQYEGNTRPGNNSRIHITNYVNANYYANGLFNQIAPENLIYWGGSSPSAYYPAAPEQIDFKRGRLSAQEVYSASGELLSRIENTFEEKWHENYWIRGFKMCRFQYQDGPQEFGFTYYKLRTGFSYEKTTRETLFKDGKELVTFVENDHESSYHKGRTQEKTVNSVGDTIIRKMYYSFDYADATDPAFAKMKRRNILVPIANRIWKNGLLVEGSVTQFRDVANAGDTTLKPVAIYNFESVSPFTPTQAAENIPLSGQLTKLIPNPHFKQKVRYAYDPIRGDLIEQQLINDKTAAIIWDTQLSLPIAQVNNGAFSEIAYNSFETGATGNLQFSSAATITDATVPTGARCYSLNSTSAITKSGLQVGKQYIVSYWVKNGTPAVSNAISTVTGIINNGWQYIEKTVSNTTTVSITGTCLMDELRIYPKDAAMTTCTYNSSHLLQSSCGEDNSIIYYEYDNLLRLTTVKDRYRNIVKAIDYNFGKNAQ